MTKLTPTQEQQEIIDAFEWGLDLVIEAGAGTGKTSTLKLLAAASSGTGVYIAYNRSIAADAERSFPASVTCKTAHGLAYAAIGSRFRHRLNGPRVPAQRTAQILGIHEPLKIGEIVLAPQQLASKAMETVTRWCYSADDKIMWRHVPIIHGLDKAGQLELAKYLAPIAQRAWDDDLSRVDGQLRYQHDHYLKAWTLTKPQLPCDYVLLDEAQDSNGCVAGLVSSQEAQRVWVGDRQQSIYGWRGATDAMEHAPGQRLYLSQSFRFGPAVAGEANKWLDLLDAPLRLRGYEPIASRVEPVAEPDAILCRSNAGAVTAVINALAEGRKPALVGGGAEIRRFAEAAMELQERGSTSHSDLFAFGSWSQVQAYVEQEADGSDLRVMVRLVDQYGAREVIRLVDSLVDEDHADVVVSTAHKAKGREWPTVRIASDFAPPGTPPGQAPAEVSREEMMLAYVAVTRAREVLDRGGLAWVDDYTGPAPVATAPEPVDDEEPELEPAPSTVERPTPQEGQIVRYRDKPSGGTYILRAVRCNQYTGRMQAVIQDEQGREYSGVALDRLEVAV